MDVAAVLEYGQTANMLKRLDDDEHQKLESSILEGSRSGHGGARYFVIINESGLYNAILGSKKPEAKRFKRWVTHEVLPSIRKTGGYVQP